MKTPLITLIVLLAMTLARARAEWRFDAETGAIYNSNLSNSDRSSDAEHDWVWATDLHLGNAIQLSRDLRLGFGAELGGRVWNEYQAFNEIAPGASANLRYRFGLGRMAPWVSLEDELRYSFFRETVRNGWENALRLRGGIALSERLALEGGYTFENFAARDDFFDLQGHRLDARLLFDLTSALRLTLGYSFRDGNVISYAIPPRPDILRITSERRSVSTFDDDYTAYRLPGITNSVSVSAAYSPVKWLSVEVGYEYDSTSHRGLTYENHLLEAKVAVAY